MAKLLYIDASVGKERSAPMLEVGKVFLDAYQESHPNDQLEPFNVWDANLEALDEVTMDASYAIIHRRNHTAAQAAAWEKIVRIVNQFKAADKYVFTVPMWHLGIPYRLKHYLDLLIHPSQTFQYVVGEKAQGLLPGKPAVVVYSRFDGYRDGSGFENYESQKGFMEKALRVIGFTRIHSLVVVEPMPGSQQCSDPENARAKDLAIRMATRF
ncbi:MAG: FMN-dependent NADH-azoreductase [Nitrospirales bacterium]